MIGPHTRLSLASPVVGSTNQQGVTVDTPKPTAPKVRLSETVKPPTKSVRKATKRAFTLKPLTHRPFAGLASLMETKGA